MPPSAPLRMLASALALTRRPQVLAVGTQLSGAALALVSFVLLARLLAPADFGVWVLFLTSATFLDMVRHGLVQSALVQRSADATEAEAEALMGGAWVLGLLTTTVLALGVYVAGALIPDPGAFWLFFEWYPLLALIVLPYQVATWDCLARERFGRLLVLHLVLRAGFAGFVALALFAPALGLVQGGLDSIAQAYLWVQVAASALMLGLGWTRLGALRYATRDAVVALYQFGRFSVGTMLGSNLLRSADQFLLGIWLGPTAVAFYGVPQKLIEIVEVPLRGLAQTAMPPLARLARRGETAAFADYVHRWTGGLTLALVPVLVGVFVWAEACCVLLGGEPYREAAPLLRIFVVYMALLPLDRYLGLALDALGQPALNMVKVIVMVVINVGGDIAVLTLFGSVEAVAGVTIAMTVVGVVLGVVFLRRAVPFRLGAVVTAGPAGLRLLARRGRPHPAPAPSDQPDDASPPDAPPHSDGAPELGTPLPTPSR